MGHRGVVGLGRYGWLGIFVSHPCARKKRKNGAPGESDTLAFPPIRDDAVNGWGTESFCGD